MTCLSQLDYSMYADGALAEREAAAVERHAATCAECRASLANLIQERRVLQASLRQLQANSPIPAFSCHQPHHGPIAAAASIIALASASLLAAGLLGSLSLPAPLAWLNPLGAPGLINFFVALLLFLASEGRSMVTSMIETTGTFVLLALFMSVGFAVLRRRPGAAAAFSCALAVLASISPAQALEIRRSDEVVSVPSGETIDDTLIAMGDSIEIDGTVTGDVIAFGRRVVIRGTVQGQLFTGARSVRIEGEIGGSVLGAAQSLELANGGIARNLIGFARDITTGGSASIAGNAVVFASNAQFAGPVAVDVLGFAEELEISNTIGGNVTAYAGSVTLLAPARVEGSVTAHVGSEDDLRVSPEAVIGGGMQAEISDRDQERGADGPGSFLLGQAVRLAAAFVTGLILLWLVPSLRRMSLDTAGETVTAAGAGLVMLVAIPIIAVMIGITLIGLPVALLALMLWLAGLYFAKIVVAHFIGRTLLERISGSPNLALSLLVGLVLVLIVVNLPFVGGLLNFLLTITGFGMLVIYLWGRFQRRDDLDADDGALAG